MKVIEKFLEDNNFTPIDEIEVPSKSHPGSFHKIIIFKNGHKECDCVSFQMRESCSHIKKLEKEMQKTKEDL
jgi:hypothetical protein